MRRLAILVLAIALVAAACGGEAADEPAQPPPPTPETVPSPEEAPSPSPEAGGPVRVRLVEVAALEEPLALAIRDADPALYVAEKTGRVMVIRDGEVDPEPVLDLAGQVSEGGEQGLLGLAFSPQGDFLYVNFTDPDGDTHVTEFRMGDDRADPGSRRDVLIVDQPFGNHNGGNLAFGPDGYLYVGLGDGGSGGDPLGAGQSLETLLGKMIRIDPRPSGDRRFRIPRDNPFVGQGGALPAIWAYGLRNPWRYSFDRETGDLWIGDVGQNSREEIDFQPGSSAGGENYGWDRLEGTQPFEGSAPPDAVTPIHDYGRDQGGSVIGGYVYRGSAIPGLVGTYLFGDFFNPSVMALRVEGGEIRVRPLGVEVPGLVSFGEDQEGELYALSLSGGVFRIAPRG